MRIKVLKPGLANRVVGFTAWEGGEEFDYPDDAENRGWLDGQIAQGHAVILPEAHPAEQIAEAKAEGLDGPEPELRTPINPPDEEPQSVPPEKDAAEDTGPDGEVPVKPRPAQPVATPGRKKPGRPPKRAE